MAWLARHHPHLVRRYEAMYAGGSYAPKWYQRRVTRQVHEFAAEFGMGPTRRGAARGPAEPHEAPGHGSGREAAPGPADPEPTQLTLL
jgi:hypothetical protein